MKRTLFVIITLLTLLTYGIRAHATKQTTCVNSLAAAAVDVDSIGDLWIFTIDKSGSMMNRHTPTPAVLATSTIQRLEQLGILDLINYQHDYISVYISGYNWPGMAFAKSLATCTGFDTCFIHNTSVEFQRFSTNQARGFKAFLKDVMSKSDYKNRYSFVSQIRTYSLVKAVKHAQHMGYENRFNKIHIITITDDADQNDQWKLDYRYLKDLGKKRFDEVTATTARYIYSPLNGQGAGWMEEVEGYYDEEGIPHIWMYNYTPRQQLTPTLSYDSKELFSVTASDGKSIKFAVRKEKLDDLPVQFYSIDSISIDGKTTRVGKYLTSSLVVPIQYTNGLTSHEIVCYGGAQVAYNDSIYGPHYKKYPYKQITRVAPGRERALVGTTIGIIGLTILLALLFVIGFLPFAHLFKLYSSDGSRLSVRRGYRFLWKDTTTAILAMGITQNDVRIVFNKHICIRQDDIVRTDGDGQHALLLESWLPLTISADVVQINTKQDVEKYFAVRRGDYNPILQQVYSQTRVASLYDKKRAEGKTWNWLYQLLIDICNLFHPRYYYIINCTKQQDNNLIFSSRWLPGKQFLMEIHTQTKASETDDDKIISSYYQSTQMPQADVLVAITPSSTFTTFRVYRLCKDHRTNGCMTAVQQLMTFEAEPMNTLQLKEESLRLKKHLMRRLLTHRVVIMPTTCYSTNAIVHFNITPNTYPAFLTLVETSAEERTQPMFSPIDDCMLSEKMVSVMSSTNNLRIYASILPFRSKKDKPIAARCLDLQIIDASSPSLEPLRITSEYITFKNLKLTR